MPCFRHRSLAESPAACSLAGPVFEKDPTSSRALEWAYIRAGAQPPGCSGNANTMHNPLRSPIGCDWLYLLLRQTCPSDFMTDLRPYRPPPPSAPLTAGARFIRGFKRIGVVAAVLVLLAGV